MLSYVLMFLLIVNTIAVNLLAKRGSDETARRLDKGFALTFTPLMLVAVAYLTLTVG
jgi:hypothetical protein